MALGIVFGIVFIVLVCRSRGISEEVSSIWIWPCLLYICLYLILFSLILPVQCLSAHKHFYMLFLFKMTFLGRGSFNRLRINAPKQRNGANTRNMVRQVVSSVPNCLANSSKKKISLSRGPWRIRCKSPPYLMDRFSQWQSSDVFSVETIVLCQLIILQNHNANLWPKNRWILQITTCRSFTQTVLVSMSVYEKFCHKMTCGH